MSPVVKRRGGEVYDERFTGCVYVVRAEGTNAVKVGFSKDVKTRIAALQTASPFLLVLLGYYIGFEESHERAVHALMSNRRARLDDLARVFIMAKREPLSSLSEVI